MAYKIMAVRAGERARSIRDGDNKTVWHRTRWDAQNHAAYLERMAELAGDSVTYEVRDK